MADIAALKKHLWKKLADSPFVMMGVKDGTHAIPLTAQLDEDQADTLFFFIGKGNRLARGGDATVNFIAKGHDYFASLSGSARVDNDFAMIDKLWNKQAEAWFPGGRDDPNLALLRFDIDDAELWETDMSLSGAFKMLFGGRIRGDEEGSHARVSTTALS